MKRLSWELIQKFYKDNFGIGGWLVELYANLDILVLCASGTSNKNISIFTEIPIEEVERVLENTLDFKGWEVDLPMNPYRTYSDIMSDFEKITKSSFIVMMNINLNKDPLYKDIDSENVYRICKAVWEIESKIKDEWI